MMRIMLVMMMISCISVCANNLIEVNDAKHGESDTRISCSYKVLSSHEVDSLLFCCHWVSPIYKYSVE